MTYFEHRYDGRVTSSDPAMSLSFARPVAASSATAMVAVEPPIVEREQAPYVEGDKAWTKERLPILEERVRDRLGELSSRLGEAEWLDGEFSAGDLIMVMVLRRLDGTGLLEEYPNLSAYVARGEERPAYKRAFDARLAVFTGNAATG